MFLAGALSRVPLADVGPPKSCLRPDHEEVCCIELEDVNTAEFLQVSNDGLKNIQCLTIAGEQLQGLKIAVLEGWPETKQEVKHLLNIGHSVTKLESTTGCYTKAIELSSLNHFAKK